LSHRLHCRYGWPSSVECLVHLCQPSRHVHGLLMGRRYAAAKIVGFRWVGGGGWPSGSAGRMRNRCFRSRSSCGPVLLNAFSCGFPACGIPAACADAFITLRLT